MTVDNQFNKTTGADSKTGERVAHLFRTVWGGSQQRMSRALGFSQPLISKVINGRQAPGRKFLAALAAQPGVNPTWLLTGKGEPSGPGDLEMIRIPGESLPLTRHLVPGPPDRFSHLFSGSYLSVAAVENRPSRYLYEVTATDIAAFRETGLQANDHLLMETDPEYWKANLMILDGAVCAVMVDGASGPVCLLSCVHLERGTWEVRISISGSPEPSPRKSAMHTSSTAAGI